MGEREREREGQRERETGKKTDTDRDRERDSERERGSENILIVPLHDVPVLCFLCVSLCPPDDAD